MSLAEQIMDINIERKKEIQISTGYLFLFFVITNVHIAIVIEISQLSVVYAGKQELSSIICLHNLSRQTEFVQETEGWPTLNDQHAELAV